MGRRLLTVAAGAAVVAPFAIGLASGAEPDAGRVVLSFADPEIVESSGLVAAGDRVWTVNDSGDIGRVFTVDAGTGRTVGVTYWADGPTDVEALAPAGPGHVWVGDIGDNTASRDSVQVTRVPVGDGDRTVDEETIDLVYPDGARDAEALLADPTTGRLLRRHQGGLRRRGLRRAAGDGRRRPQPARPGRPGGGPGRPTGPSSPTGATSCCAPTRGPRSTPGPTLESLGSWDLPAQPQGEGIAVAPDGRLLPQQRGPGRRRCCRCRCRRRSGGRWPGRARPPPPPRPRRSRRRRRPTGAATSGRARRDRRRGRAPPRRPVPRADGWWAGSSAILALGVLWRSLRPH